MDVGQNLFGVVPLGEGPKIVEQSAKEGRIKPPETSGEEREPCARYSWVAPVGIGKRQGELQFRLRRTLQVQPQTEHLTAGFDDVFVAVQGQRHVLNDQRPHLIPTLCSYHDGDDPAE